jgi:hypothetical protein
MIFECAHDNIACSKLQKEIRELIRRLPIDGMKQPPSGKIDCLETMQDQSLVIDIEGNLFARARIRTIESIFHDPALKLRALHGVSLKCSSRQQQRGASQIGLMQIRRNKSIDNVRR